MPPGPAREVGNANDEATPALQQGVSPLEILPGIGRVFEEVIHGNDVERVLPKGYLEELADDHGETEPGNDLCRLPRHLDALHRESSNGHRGHVATVPADDVEEGTGGYGIGRRRAEALLCGKQQTMNPGMG